MENNLENRHFFSRMLTRKKKSSSKKDSLTLLKEMIDASDDCFDPLLTFSEKQLSQATNNYDSLHLLHSDGGGYKWYKGSLEGQIVSIKKAEDNNEWPKLDHAINNIAMAVEMNSQVNSLKIIGICLKPRIPIMVYKFAKNGTLYDYIRNSNGAYSDHPFAWNSRLRIASEIATTVAYLHTAFRTPIIHRDINPSNVFLDHQYAAKLFDFSLSVSLPDRETQAEVEVCGDLGFVSPEYLSTHIVTVKSDVFSFGMFLFVLVTGNRVFEARRLVQDGQHASFQDYLKKSIQSDEVNSILDPRILEEGGWIDIQQQVQAVSELALRCIENNVDERPTMVDVTKQLKQIAELSRIFSLDVPQEVALPVMSNPRSKNAQSVKSATLYYSPATASPTRVTDPGNPSPQPSSTTTVHDFGLKVFKYRELLKATDGFSQTNCLGEGGFGSVFKAVLPDNTIGAVKVLKNENFKGDSDFRTEVNAISRAIHKHIVSLIGYCIHADKRLIVFEFVANNSLHHYLHGGDEVQVLDWAKRVKIALGTAKGLVYLHEDCPHKIIHRDVKPANILLDFNFEAKVADFGIAKLCSDSFDSHLFTGPVGTIGYVDPDYFHTGILTVKSDVYSFGVVLLELVSGCRPQTMHELLIKLPKALKKCNFDTLADPRLQKTYDTREMTLMVVCADACLRKEAKDRPLMKQIAHVLEGLTSLAELKKGTKGASCF